MVNNRYIFLAIILLANISLLFSVAAGASEYSDAFASMSDQEEEKQDLRIEYKFGNELWNSVSGAFYNQSRLYQHDDARLQNARSQSDTNSSIGSEITNRFETNYGIKFQTEYTSDMDVFKIDGRLEASTLNNSHVWESPLAQSSSTTRNHLQLHEFYYNYGQPDYDFVVGKKAVNAGVAQIVSVADRFNRLDATDPIRTRSEGVWQASYSDYSEPTTLTASIMPAYEPPITPPAESRWAGVLPTFDAPGDVIGAINQGDSVQVQQNIPSSSIKDWQYLIKIAGQQSGIDWSATVFRGKFGPIPDVEGNNQINSISDISARDTTTVDVNYLDVYSASASLSATALGGVWYSEAMYQVPVSREDDTFFKAMAGTNHNISPVASLLDWSTVSATIEITDDYVIKKGKGGRFQTSRPVRPTGLTVYSQLVGVVEMGEMRFDVTGQYNTSNNSSALVGGGKYWINDNFSIQVRQEYFSGNRVQGSDASVWENNDRIVFETRYKF